ncbi:hypothetical protein BT67DRAFT_51086 [Trichocladium antarcticum]|uniref:Uncharacterized protein n=1 Tax=Trichocladium antarcticum TaxID=1450529 RepID=A0AAN6ZD54_9PEZI|nr:hypothetical protein BT67DRAFT_51086 [Trichocladium antarcticum]
MIHAPLAEATGVGSFLVPFFSSLCNSLSWFRGTAARTGIWRRRLPTVFSKSWQSRCAPSHQWYGAYTSGSRCNFFVQKKSLVFQRAGYTSYASIN